MNVKNSSPAKDRFNLLLKNADFLLADLSQDDYSDGFQKMRDVAEGPWAFDSMNIDPYWPKWNSPWWHFTLAMELGCKQGIFPTSVFEHFATRINRHYLQVFPIKEEELPPGKDPMVHILCFCAMGTAIQILEAQNINTDERIPWLRSWFQRYQLADGGYNCDEAAYIKDQPRSSIVSTVPMLEALLKLSERGLSRTESEILDSGIAYLLKRCLFKSICKNAPMDPDFTRLTFPRFYEYDVLRGLSLVCSWAVRFERTLPFGAIGEALDLCCSKIRNDGQLLVDRQFYADKKTLMYENGGWTRGHDATSFALLQKAGALQTPSYALTRSLMDVFQNLRKLDECGLVTF